MVEFGQDQTEYWVDDICICVEVMAQIGLVLVDLGFQSRVGS